MTARIPWQMVLISGILVSLGIGGCSKSSPSGNRASVGGPQGDAISSFTLVGHTETGRKKWEIRGQSADILAQTVHLSPVAATAFGEIRVDLAAQHGQYQKGTQDVELEKDVVVTTTDGARLTTDSFIWLAQREMGTTPAWVTVTRPGIKIVGRGGICFPKIKRVRLEREITVTLQGEHGQTVVTCDGPMEVDYGRRKARFWRNVLVRDPKGEIRSDRMDVTLEPGKNEMQKAIFWGHVRINQEGRVAHANRANYWQPLGRTSLVGHPKLVMVPDNDKLGLGE